MNNIRNSVQLIGHVGQDPEVSVLEDGKKLAKFSMATNEVYTNSQGEKVEKTYWHRLVLWNKLAEVAENHITKGTKVAVEGKLTTHSWEDDFGVKHYRTEVVGRELLLL